MTRTSVTGIVGELLLTAGLVVLLFAGYEVWGTGWATAREQEDLTATLEREWSAPPDVTSTATGPAPVPGRPFLRIHIPAFGPDYARAVLEGVDQGSLASGPGHYPGSALPGEVGNVAIAGHRVSHGAPFDEAGELRSCDAIMLETRDTWWVYRVLPSLSERPGWDAQAAARPSCQGVVAPAEPYADAVGTEIVLPSQTEVVAPIPHRPGVAPIASLVTLTTCHPRFSARERLIVHGMLVARYDKRDHEAGWRPAELAEA